MKIKKIISVLLAALMIGAIIPVAALAAEKENASVKILSYNVSGIPIIGTFQGSNKVGGNKKAAIVGKILNEKEYDIIGVQEDFNFHNALAAEMTAFPYQTISSGRLPLGSGLNIFSKHPIYNVSRAVWDQAYGVISGAADRIAQKGFVHSVVEIAEGIYIDVYVIHADAGRDEKSIAARADNYRQVVEAINSREYDRAAIVTGDFNSTFERNTAEKIGENLMKPAGLKDVWAELYNGGNYDYNNGEGWNPTQRESIDKVLYKNGGGIEFTPKSLEYLEFTDENGKTYTDHVATGAELSYKIVGSTVNTQELNVEKAVDQGEQFKKEVSAFFDTIKLVLSSFGEIKYLINQLFVEVLKLKPIF